MPTSKLSERGKTWKNTRPRDTWEMEDLSSRMLWGRSHATSEPGEESTQEAVGGMRH